MGSARVSSSSPLPPWPLLSRLLPTSARSPNPAPELSTSLQGMAAAKAKLEFVRAYYEFSPKSLYKDERGAGAEKKEGA